MREKIKKIIKQEGFSITPEVELEIEELAQTLEAEEHADIKEVLDWLEEKREKYGVKVEEIGINDLDKWSTHPETGNIGHESGKFFTMMGIRVTGAKGREVISWTQPMMKQNECGILGILRQKQKGIMRYLLYAKSEPGAIINPQLAPTLQATASNLAKAHGGNKPLFAEYFEEGKKQGKIIVAVEHVEDPSRFYLKTNRCMIVEIPEKEKIMVPEDFVWLTLPQIKKLLKMDNLVNALARSVFGSI